MRKPATFLPALALILACVSAVASAMPTAVERGAVVQEGINFHKPIVLDTVAFCDGSVRLEKGSYDVKFESLGNNKVRATFFQGGLRKGEANGIIVVARAPANDPSRGYIGETEKNLSFEALGLHPASAHAFQRQGGKLNLVVNGQGTNQILIGLLLPAVQKGGIIGPLDQKIQPAGAPAGK
jgi:hypothetical protein